MNLNNVSKVKQDLILQALTAWELYKDNKGNFVKAIRELGWKKADGYGSFKECLWKGSMVAKYSRNNNDANQSEVKREFEQQSCVPDDLKKHFPKIYIFNRGLLIQDKVLLKCNPNLPYPCDIERVAEDFSGELEDYYHNHGHSKVGTVKFFDWVYRRRGRWLGNLSNPLYEV